VRGNDPQDREINRIVVVVVILVVEQEVQCVGVVHLEEVVLIVHHEKCQDVAEIVASNKIVGLMKIVRGWQTIEITEEVQMVLPVVEDVVEREANLDRQRNIKIVEVRNSGIISKPKIVKTEIVKIEIVVAKTKIVIEKTGIVLIENMKIETATIEKRIVRMVVVEVVIAKKKITIVKTEIIRIEIEVQVHDQ